MLSLHELSQQLLPEAVAQHMQHLVHQKVQPGLAIQIALQHVQTNSKDVKLVRQLVALARRHNMDVQTDAVWEGRAASSVQSELEQLKRQLKMSQQDAALETQVQLQLQLAQLQSSTGEPHKAQNALQGAYQVARTMKARQTILSVCERGIVLALCANDFTAARNWANRTLKEDSMYADTPRRVFSKRRRPAANRYVCGALATLALQELRNKKLLNAVDYFVLLSPEYAESPVSRILFPSALVDIVCLLALARLPRNELKTRLLDNKHFSPLISEHNVNASVRALHAFLSSRFTEFLSLITLTVEECKLHPFLFTLVVDLQKKARAAAVRTYCEPYAAASITKMAAAFSTTVTSLEHELVNMIIEGSLTGRVDSHSKVLLSQQKNTRSNAFEVAIDMADKAAHRLENQLLASACTRAGAVLRMPPASKQDAQDDMAFNMPGAMDDDAPDYDFSQ